MEIKVGICGGVEEDDGDVFSILTNEYLPIPTYLTNPLEQTLAY